MSSAIKTPAFQAKASNILNEDNSSIYSGGEWSFKNASAVTGFHVDADGKVGVGTTSPGAQLDIHSASNAFNPIQVRFNASNDVLGFGIANSNGFPYIGYNTKSAAGTDIPTYERTNFATQLRMNNGEFRFSTAASGTAGTPISFTERMRIDANGNVLGSGKLGQDFTATGWQLTALGAINGVVAGNADACAAYNKTTNTGQVIYSGYSNVGSILSTKFAVFADGNVRIAAGSTFGNFSDIKFKENIVDATPKLDDVLKLQVRNFTIKNEGLKAIGFIAQEFEQVFPALVVTSPDKDYEGNDLGTESKAIKESALIPILVKSIQELSAKVDAQAAEIEALKAK